MGAARRPAWLAALLLLGAAPAAGELRATRLDLGAPLAEPSFLAAPPGDARLFIAELAGLVRIAEHGALLPAPFLDLTVPVDDRGEGGLLGLAFPADYAASGFFYVYYTGDIPGSLFESRASRFRVSAADPNVADPASELVFFSLTQPFLNHNGGTLAIRGDFLYLGLGDGGDGGDPLEAAQDDTNLLGKLLRFDLRGAAPGPAQIWAKGLRNPFRFSFDRATGDLYLADVGQSAREEVDVEPAGDPGGRNYGWDVREGSLCFEPPDPGEPACSDPSLVDPVHEYAHTAGRCSITGGVVYRGSSAADAGHYLFGDHCTGEIWSFVWDGAGGVVGGVVDRTAELGAISHVVAFGEDSAGELYVVDLDGEIVKVPEPDALWLELASVLVLLTLARARRAHGAARVR